ncbi:ABC transporter ATP-binding protein [Frondihabitans australicus]|uniref:Putative ABC transport system ATP-binding protein n=1 Tax=Frondihabitans australicus TaxID=386892 RepID=A0A495IDB0_9MICO|nr:ATP-binding cassette domain-containing protein [Frondihabitans australicus]RKR73993.1 putative ABC transport system ATP-binding protein [Frondihabitans australicus]
MSGIPAHSGAEGVVCTGLRHEYVVDGSPVVALDDVSLRVEAGATAAIIGPSGSGKSTLLTLLAGLQRPTAGSVFVGETDLTALDERRLLRLRATRLAVVAQNPFRNLLPYGTCVDNLLFAQRAPRSHGRSDLPAIEPLLDEIGLSRVAGTRCDRLSGGERQRLALAAALATGPSVLVTDEPTSQLDSVTGAAVADLLVSTAVSRGVTVIAVTHDTALASRMDTRFRIADGRLVP